MCLVIFNPVIFTFFSFLFSKILSKITELRSSRRHSPQRQRRDRLRAVIMSMSSMSINNHCGTRRWWNQQWLPRESDWRARLKTSKSQTFRGGGGVRSDLRPAPPCTVGGRVLGKSSPFHHFQLSAAPDSPHRSQRFPHHCGRQRWRLVQTSFNRGSFLSLLVPCSTKLREINIMVSNGNFLGYKRATRQTVIWTHLTLRFYVFLLHWTIWLYKGYLPPPVKENVRSIQLGISIQLETKGNTA